MNFQRKYGVAATIRIPLIKAGSTNHAVSADWTPAAGDVKISKDGGAWANVTNLPTATTVGNAATWAFSLTATEMQAAVVEIEIADAATKAIEDDHFQLETYGNASANIVFDLSSANVTLANVAQTIASLTVSGAGGVTITNTTAGGAGMSITGNTTGAGLLVTGGTSGDGLKAVAGSSTGSGINAVASGGNNIGLKATGVGTGSGAEFIGGTTGVGFKASAGATGNGAGAEFTGGGHVGGGIGFLVTGTGTKNGAEFISTSGYGIKASGTTAGLYAVGSTGMGAWFAGNTYGLDCHGNIAGLRALGASNDASGLLAQGNDAGHGIYATVAGVPTGNGMYLSNGSGTGKAMVATPTTTDIAAPTVAQIWEEALSSHSGVAGSMAAKLSEVALDSTVAKTAGSIASVSGAVGSVTGNIGGNLVGNVNGNVVGSVASVTGAVGSVTGAVGSVTGAVGSVTGSVGSVTGDVGGNLVGNVNGSVASVTGAVGSVTGAVGSVTGAVGSVTGDVGGNLVGNVNGNVAGSVASVTGAVASVTGNVGGNVVGSVASVTGNVGGNLVGNVNGNVAGSVASVTGLTVANLDVAVSTRLASAGYTAPPSSANIADAVWDEATAGHATAGTTGLALTSAASVSASATAAAVWDEPSAGHVIAGSAGAVLASRYPNTGLGAGSVNITVTDGVDPISNVLVRLRDGATVVAQGYTDVNGELTLAHSGGPDLSVAAYLASYSFAVYDIGAAGPADVIAVSITGVVLPIPDPPPIPPGGSFVEP